MDEPDAINPNQTYFDVLKNFIYGAVIEDLREGDYSKRDFNFRIRLGPTKSFEIPCLDTDGAVYLYAKSVPDYPYKIPIFKVEPINNVVEDDLQQVVERVDKLSSQLIGDEVMLFNVIIEVESALWDIKLRKYENEKFHKELIKSQKDTKEAEKAYVVEVLSKRRANILKEKRLRRHDSTDNDVDETCKCADEIGIIVFSENGGQEVCLAKCDHNWEEEGYVKFDGFDLKNRKYVTIYRWVFDNQADKYRIKVISDVLEDFLKLKKLKRHYILPYTNINLETNGTNVIVCLLTDLLNETPLPWTLEPKTIRHHLKFLIEFVHSVSNALDFLHSHDLWHGNLRREWISISPNGNIKVANCYLHRRLIDLYQNVVKPHTRRMDLFDFGVVLFKLVADDISINIKHIPSWLPHCFQDFLATCLCLKTNDIPSCLSNHDMFKENSVTEDEEPANTLINPYLENDSVLANVQPNSSRYLKEFDVIKKLGQGGFGAVYKVQNKLDNAFYAIKRMKLTANLNVNQTLIEIILLSNLKHPNVVRYFSSWIEYASTNEDGKKWNVYNNVVAPSVSSVAEICSQDESSEVDGSVDESVNDESIKTVSLSGIDIQFLPDTQQSVVTKKPPKSRNNSSSGPKHVVYYLYIQMELCEKNTLRNAIENGLFKETARIWKLFRQILEGLAFIHKNNVIHRDLKPENIFINKDDEISIGDFGLALLNDRRKFVEKNTNGNKKAGDHIVGTHCYMAPELIKADYKVYDQLIDVYSVGVILFEMCYFMKTKSERAICINNLRKPEIIFPKDFRETEFRTQIDIIKLVLNHDPSKRPEAKKLLRSKLVPVPQKSIHEVQEVLNYIFLNKDASGAYKRMISELFDQQIDPIIDISFNMKIPTKDEENQYPALDEPLQWSVIAYLQDLMKPVFELHRAIDVSTPLLTPASELIKQRRNCVEIATRTSDIVLLPYDLHLSLARYVVDNNMAGIRRYSFSKCYSPVSLTILAHPEETFQAVFDIVEQCAGDPFKHDAELISIVDEIIQKLSVRSTGLFKIEISHFSILKALLLHHKIEPRLFNEIFSILLVSDDENWSNYKKRDHLRQKGLSNNDINNLSGILAIDLPVDSFMDKCKSVIKRNDDVAVLLKEGLECFQSFCKHLEALQVKLKVTVRPSVVATFDQYNGLLFRIVFKPDPRKDSLTLAIGGRYDKFVSDYKKYVDTVSCEIDKEEKRKATGLTLNFKSCISLIKEYSTVRIFDVFLCSVAGDEDTATQIIDCLVKNSLRFVQFQILVRKKEAQYLREQYPIPVVVIHAPNEPITMFKYDKSRHREDTFINIKDVVDELIKIAKILQKPPKI